MSHHSDTLLWIFYFFIFLKLCLSQTWHTLSRKNNARGQSDPPKPPTAKQENSSDQKLLHCWSLITSASPEHSVPSPSVPSVTRKRLQSPRWAGNKWRARTWLQQRWNHSREPPLPSMHQQLWHLMSSMGTAYVPIKVIGNVRTDTTTSQYSDLKRN